MFFSAVFYFAAVATFGKPAIGSKLNNRIVNGTDAAVGQFPYLVSLAFSRSGTHGCGGTILTQRHVLTAAHCVHAGVDLVRVAVTTLSSDPKVYHEISEIHVHPQNDPRRSANDIAIIVVTPPMKFNELVQPISVETRHVGAGVAAVISGFGRLAYQGDRTDRLQYLFVRTLDNGECQQRNVYPGFNVTNDMICAWSRDQEGACHGDSGSPLVANGKLVGVASWVIIPCAKGEPDVYVRVSRYVEWINDVIQSTV